MRLWRVVLLLNLALAAGLLLGYLAWGRQIGPLEEELALARQRFAPAGVEQVFTGQGVVRALITELHVVVLSHEDIPGFMPAMTMGFQAQDPELLAAAQVGDLVRFTLRGVPPRLAITRLEKQGQM
ncbi:MAG: copper-binding protein [Candidatus Rokubacteria bacterium]|nr:copper-binding protein [Candidatus Rokubacteria bacterium]MBI3107129.1 copper-binding protein [Candidatus Rokubacteria bacterium]